MNFFLHTPTTKSSVNILHQEYTLLLGSCFTENIGNKLKEAKFNCTTNPFGIIYNPVSLAHSLTQIINNKSYLASDLIQQNELWLSFDHHGSFSSFNQQECLDQINKEITCANQHLQKTKTMVVTLGTAWVYETVEAKKLVANCHKLPSKNFNKRLLLVDEVLESFSKIISSLNNINFIFTISPVRHVSDGLHENNISKSVLHLAVHELVNQHKNCHYFGAYEMVIDELRDYRFYKEDMIHPTSQAIDYVWNNFATTYFTNQTQELNLKIEKLRAAVQHKPFRFESESHQQFINKQMLQMQQLEKEFPFLSFDEEKAAIQLYGSIVPKVTRH